jgi:hypothetical protein
VRSASSSSSAAKSIAFLQNPFGTLPLGLAFVQE